MKIIGISGSLRSSSTNTALLYATAALAPKELDLTIYKGLGDLPHFTPELDGDTSPRAVRDWRALLENSDGVLIGTPEYVYGMPGVLKNALDWLVSSGELVGKPVATIIKANNTASLHAHQKMGMCKMTDFTYGGTEFLVFAYSS